MVGVSSIGSTQPFYRWHETRASYKGEAADAEEVPTGCRESEDEDLLRRCSGAFEE